MENVSHSRSPLCLSLSKLLRILVYSPPKRVFFGHSGRITLVHLWFLLVHKTPGSPTSSMAQCAQLSGGSKLIRLASSRTGPGRQCVSFFLSPGLTTYQRVNTTVNDKPVTTMPPTQDAPEDYVVRHKIIALHLAVTVGGAKFYPFCTRIRISLVFFFPGAYNDNDPCIYDPSVYPELPTLSSVHRVEPRAACGHDSGQLSRRRRN